MKYLLLLLLIGCGPQGVCQTRAGLDVLDLQTWTCADVQAVEDAALREFKLVTDVRFSRGGANLYGFRVQVMPGRYFNYVVNGEVRLATGLTYCDRGQLYVGDTGRAMGSSLTHELAHVVQGCDRTMKTESLGKWAGNVDHANWDSAGIEAAIHRVIDP